MNRVTWHWESMESNVIHFGTVEDCEQCSPAADRVPLSQLGVMPKGVAP